MRSFPTLTCPKSGNMCMYMQVRTNSFEDNGMAVFAGYLGGYGTFGSPPGLLPEGARVVDGTERVSLENRWLMEKFLGRGEVSS